MFESHRPFIQKVLELSSEYNARKVEAFLDGEFADPRLSLMKGAWSRGNPTQMKTFAYLPEEAIDFIKEHVDTATAKGNEGKNGGLGQDAYIAEALAMLTRQMAIDNAKALGDAARNLKTPPKQ